VLTTDLKPARRLQMFWVLPAVGLLLMAADPAWKNKTIRDWTTQDADQILTNSPWAKLIVAGINRKQTEDERRAGGNMGDAKGVGYDGIQQTKAQLPSNIPDLLTGRGGKAATSSKSITVRLRWESALPIRAAELKNGVIEPPTLPGDGYQIAVYGVPRSDAKGDPKKLGDPLKESAFLRREGKKDVKPTSVEAFERDDSVVVVYLFPLSAEISVKDGHIEFVAAIGRIAIDHAFDVTEMQFQGKLEI
jgi:hypothetical protein